MPRVHYRKAGKDYPSIGIAKGEMYYTWRIKTTYGGTTHRSQTAPRPSQLTHSEYKSQAYALIEQMEDALKGDVEPEDIQSAAQEAVSEAENLRDEEQSKLDNMPEGLQQGDTGQLIQERIDALEQFISEVEGFECEDFDPEDGEHETKEEYIDAKCDELSGIDLDVY